MKDNHKLLVILVILTNHINSVKGEFSLDSNALEDIKKYAELFKTKSSSSYTG